MSHLWNTFAHALSSLASQNDKNEKGRFLKVSLGESLNFPSSMMGNSSESLLGIEFASADHCPLT
jgi:hypothetical protein